MRGGGPQTRAAGLSGGNQQKVILAREIDRNPKVLIAAQPTRGLDVGAIEFVHRRLVGERDEGRAVLLVSLELEEILSLSDRILVMYEGEIVGEFSPGPECVSEEEARAERMTGGGTARELPRVRRQDVARKAGRRRRGRARSRALARRRLCTDRRAAVRAVAEGRRDHRSLPHRRARVPDRRDRRPHHVREEPADDLPGDLRGRGPELVPGGRLVRAARPVHRRAHPVPLERRRHRVDRRVQPAADADRLRAARPDGARGRVRLPLRALQHRHAGAVPGRLDLRRVDRVRAAGPARASSTSCSRSWRERSRAPSGRASPAS